MGLPIISCLILVSLLDKFVASSSRHFNLYTELLDQAECEKQLNYTNTNDLTLQLQFIEAGPRTPRRILKGNFRDYGSYFECLEIKKEVQDMVIQGKYSVVRIPVTRNVVLPNLLRYGSESPWTSALVKGINKTKSMLDEKFLKDVQMFESHKKGIQVLLGQSIDDSSSSTRNNGTLPAINMELAFCIPKVCTAKQTLDIMTSNLTAELEVNEVYYRLPNDKPWIAADYVAITIFSIIALLTMLCTYYDVRHSAVLKRDPKEANKLYTLFSVYTNCRNFFTFKSSPSMIHCLDGIRSFATFWIIIGHTFSNQLSFHIANPLDVNAFIINFSSLWITSATITVDTFFMLSGLLVVYTTASKMSRITLIKNLHMYYLHRLLRMFPILAAAILFEASFMRWVSDGPNWNVMTHNAEKCRQNWWVTLLYVQNFVRKTQMCLGHTWYLAIDMQMHILSPLVLFWVLGGHKKSAWTALIGSLVAVLIASTAYNFVNQFLAAPVSNSVDRFFDYMFNYYQHTLTRASPFFVGMIFGYLLHLYRGKTVHIPRSVNIILWFLAGTSTTTIIISTYFVLQPDWDVQVVNDILNSFMRPIWSASIAWMVFACHHGYGGPINWVLSLHIFKIFSRLSYALYIIHFSLIFLHNGTELSPLYFTVERSLQRFQVDINISVMAAFVLMILIDAPFSRLIGICLGGARNAQFKEDLKKLPINGA